MILPNLKIAQLLPCPTPHPPTGGLGWATGCTTCTTRAQLKLGRLGKQVQHERFAPSWTLVKDAACARVVTLESSR